MVTAQEFADRWASGLANATERIRAGVQRTTKNPMERAVEAQEKMRIRWLESVNNGHWRYQITKVSMDDWKRAMLTKGVPRVAEGANAAKPKVQAFARDLLAYEAQIKQRLDAMPKITPEDSRARMNFWFDQMRAYPTAGVAG